MSRALPTARSGIVEPRRAPARVGGVQVRTGRDDLVDRIEELIAEVHGDRPELALELLERSRADDRRRQGRVPDPEREGEVDHADPRLLAELSELLDRVELRLVARNREVVASWHAFCPMALDVAALPVLPGEPAARERAPRNDAHAVVQAGRQHLGLDAADEDRVWGLLADVARVPARLRNRLRLGDLRRRERRGAEVADLAGAL